MIHQIIIGATYVARGFRLIGRPGVRRYIVMPLLINILLFGALIGFGVSEYQSLIQWILSYLPAWLDWLGWLLWPVLILVTLLIAFYLFTPVANLISAPFNDLLAEKLEVQLTGTPVADSSGLLALAGGAPGAVANEIRKFFYMLGRMAPLLILFFIPIVNVIAPVLWFIFGAWMLAVEYTDYPMGNHDMKFQDERALLGNNRGLALGFGGGLLLLTMVPVLNFIAMPVGVAGATALWVDRLRSQVAASAGTENIQDYLQR